MSNQVIGETVPDQHNLADDFREYVIQNEEEKATITKTAQDLERKVKIQDERIKVS